MDNQANRLEWLRYFAGECLEVGDEVLVHWGGVLPDERHTISKLCVECFPPEDFGQVVDRVDWTALTDRTVMAWFDSNSAWAYGCQLYPM